MIRPYEPHRPLFRFEVFSETILSEGHLQHFISEPSQVAYRCFTLHFVFALAWCQTEILLKLHCSDNCYLPSVKIPTRNCNVPPLLMHWLLETAHFEFNIEEESWKRSWTFRILYHKWEMVVSSCTPLLNQRLRIECREDLHILMVNRSLYISSGRCMQRWDGLLSLFS